MKGERIMKIMYINERLCEVDITGPTTLDAEIAKYLGIRSICPEDEEGQHVLEQMFGMFDFIKINYKNMYYIDTSEMRFDGSLNCC